MVISTHNMNTAELSADYCAILHKGSLIKFSDTSLLTKQRK